MDPNVAEGVTLRPVPRYTMSFAGKEGCYELRNRRKQTTLCGVVAGVGFHLAQHYNLFKPDVIQGIINGKQVNLTLDKESRFYGSIGEAIVNMTLTAKKTTATLKGSFGGQMVDIKIKRGWLSTSIKGENIRLRLNSGTFSLSNSTDYKGLFDANPELIPFIISIVESIVNEENLFYIAA
jgi:hypothetical protein